MAFRRRAQPSASGQRSSGREQLLPDLHALQSDAVPSCGLQRLLSAFYAAFSVSAGGLQESVLLLPVCCCFHLHSSDEW